MSHTPGPWIVSPGLPYRIVSDNGYKPETVIADTWDGGTRFVSKPTIEANARLIAASPELLAALTVLLNHPALERYQTDQAYQDAVEALARTEGHP